MDVKWNNCKISAFADEISDDLEQQLDVLAVNEVGNIELRGVWGKNVLDLSKKEISRLRNITRSAGVGFSAIGSPIGKFPVHGNFSEERERMQKALEYAQLLEAPFIRIFSYYIPEGEDATKYRGQIIDWVSELVKFAEPTAIRIAHENERGIYGDVCERVLDLFQSISSPAFTGIFDFANFVMCGENVCQCWQKLHDYISYFHIKDAVAFSRKVVPAGAGDGAVGQILSDAYSNGFDNFLTLEPHLNIAEDSYGKTSPSHFKVAVDSLKKIIAELG